MGPIMLLLNRLLLMLKAGALLFCASGIKNSSLPPPPSVDRTWEWDVCPLPRTLNTFDGTSFADAGPQVWTICRLTYDRQISNCNWKHFCFGDRWPRRIVLVYLRLKMPLLTYDTAFRDYVIAQLLVSGPAARDSAFYGLLYVSTKTSQLTTKFAKIFVKKSHHMTLK